MHAEYEGTCRVRSNEGCSLGEICDSAQSSLFSSSTYFEQKFKVFSKTAGIHSHLLL